MSRPRRIIMTTLRDGVFSQPRSVCFTLFYKDFLPVDDVDAGGRDGAQALTLEVVNHLLSIALISSATTCLHALLMWKSE